MMLHRNAATAAASRASGQATSADFHRPVAVVIIASAAAAAAAAAAAGAARLLWINSERIDKTTIRQSAGPLVSWLTVGPGAGLGGPGIRRGVVAVRCPGCAAEQRLEGQQDHASHSHPDTSSGQDVQGIVHP